MPTSPNTSLPALVISRAISAIWNLGTWPSVYLSTMGKMVDQAAVPSWVLRVVWVRKKWPGEVKVPEVKTG